MSVLEDVKFGNEKEDECLNAFKELFDDKLKKNSYKWATLDYSCDGCYVELKSRR